MTTITTATNATPPQQAQRTDREKTLALRPPMCDNMWVALVHYRQPSQLAVVATWRTRSGIVVSYHATWILAHIDSPNLNCPA